MVPLATNNPALLARSRRCQRLPVRSLWDPRRKTSSPTTAAAMAWRMAGVGRTDVGQNQFDSCPLVYVKLMTLQAWSRPMGDGIEPPAPRLSTAACRFNNVNSAMRPRG